MSLSMPISKDNRYDEICRMVGDVSIRYQYFDSEIRIYAKRHGYNSNNKQAKEYERIFGEDDNKIIKKLADKRSVLIHEVIPVLLGGLSEEYLNRSYDDIKRLYKDFVEYYKESCEPFLVSIDEGWYQKTPEEIKQIEEAQEKAWIDSVEFET